MAGKKQYYGLDEIGFVGTQDKRTPATVKSDIERTIQYIIEKNLVLVLSLTKQQQGNVQNQNSLLQL